MDLIGGINYIENRFGERKPQSGKRKPAQKTPHSTGNLEENRPDHDTTGGEARLGQKVDTTA